MAYCRFGCPTGAKQSIFNVLYTLIDPQDEVVIFAPYWVSYPDMIKMVHGIPVVVKDNYDTVDMPTSGGSSPRSTTVPPRRQQNRARCDRSIG